MWRDNYIRIGVSAGRLDGGTIVPIAKGPLEIFVETGGGSNPGVIAQSVRAISSCSVTPLRAALREAVRESGPYPRHQVVVADGLEDELN